MAYTCQNCGVEAEDSNNLCYPISEELEGKFCDISGTKVCEDKFDAMKFSCDSCGRVSSDSEHLCNPVRMR